VSTDPTLPDIPIPPPSLPPDAWEAAREAYRGWRIGDPGEGGLHAALLAAAPLIRAEAEVKLAEVRSVLLEGGQGDATARCRAIAIVGTGEELS